MSQSRTPLALEALETRETPAILFTETFDTVTPPALPNGWNTWASDGFAVFATAANKGPDGSIGLISQAVSSRTSSMAWYPESVKADTGSAISLRADSLVPVYVFARGSDLETSSRSYLAAVVTRGLKVQLLEVKDGQTQVLGSVSQPSSAYFSGGWVRVSLEPEGESVKVNVTRQDTGQYLTSGGTWQSDPATAISATTTLTTAQGKVGVGRNARYVGSVQMDDFSLVGELPGTKESFDTTAVGSAPSGWNGWASDSTGWFKVSEARSLSPNNGFSNTGFTSSVARAWWNKDLDADVDVSAAIFAETLVPVQVFARGSNLQGTSATYYAINLTRGIEAKLVKVVNGIETTLGTVKSTSYLSGQWVRARLIAEGDRLRVQIFRTDTLQWLAPDGSWSDSPDYALEKTDSSITGGGKAGVGRKSATSGTITVDDFEAKPAGQSSGPVVNVTRLDGTGDVTGEVTFQATVTGSFNRVEFRLNNVVRAVSATSPAEWTFDSTIVLNGSYTLTVRAFDAAGNIGTEELLLTVSNPNMDPLPDPDIPRHYSHIRIAELAYSGTPITNTFEQNLLKNSIDLVIPNPRYLGPINTTTPDTPQLIYSNVSNLYQGLLIDWLRYADTNSKSRELAFYHVTKPTAFQGASPSSQPVTWFWGVYQSTESGTPTDVTSAARGGRTFNVQFGAEGTSTAIGFVEKFREMNITLARGAANGWSGVWEYVSEVDANGNPTSWKTLTLNHDATGGLRSTGRITFDPPADWIPSSMTPGGERLYSVRFRVTSGSAADGAELLTIFGRDYVNANGTFTGTIPPFDFAADKDNDGYLNDTEYANRKAGFDARFVYESRLFYPYYGQMRYVTNPSAAAVRHWAADHHERLLEANPLADGLFIDNAHGKLPFPGISVLEPVGTFAEESGALINAVSRAIAPKWVLTNTAGGRAEGDPIAAGSAAVFEEFLLRPLQANWSEVGDATSLIDRRLNAAGEPLVVIDSHPGGGSTIDARTQIATLAYYYLVADPERTFLMFYGGYNPSSTWIQHWAPASTVNVGTPTGEMTTFASGLDPANSALTYKVFARDYTNALVLYKPLSYAQGKGEGTTGTTTATTHQLGGTYRRVNSNGTLGIAVTSVTLRNGEGVLLVKA